MKRRTYAICLFLNPPCLLIEEVHRYTPHACYESCSMSFSGVELLRPFWSVSFFPASRPPWCSPPCSLSRASPFGTSSRCGCPRGWLARSRSWSRCPAGGFALSSFPLVRFSPPLLPGFWFGRDANDVDSSLSAVLSAGALSSSSSSSSSSFSLSLSLSLSLLLAVRMTP